MPGEEEDIAGKCPEEVRVCELEDGVRYYRPPILPLSPRFTCVCVCVFVYVCVWVGVWVVACVRVCVCKGGAGESKARCCRMQ